MISLRDEMVTRQYKDMIYKAKSYIDDNYMKEDISLNQVASEVFLSPSHFSSVFSQKTGQTFIKYLTDLRMNKAKELLKCTNKRTSEVGYSVGYKDPHYFSFLFRKTQNCTPSQYRNQIKAREDN
ncbi:MAG: helix-turn-helix transcriptional regulator [Clostridiales bacterium]|nr:helix-turn-helix transcriptional regulator [Clostridiales bacterium]